MARRKWDCSSVKVTQTGIRIQELPSYSCTLEGYLIKNYNAANTYCGDNDITPRITHMEMTPSQDGQQQQQQQPQPQRRHHHTCNSTRSPAGLPRISTSTLLLQTLVLLQSLLLVTSQAFPVGCEWSSSISPTMPEFQTFKLTGCGTGRLHWHIPRQARQLEARFQESSGPYQMCVEHYQSSLNGLLQVMDKTNGSNVPRDFPAEYKVCVHSGLDNDVVLNFKLEKRKGSDDDDDAINDINYQQIDNMYEIVIDINREFYS